MIQLAIIGPTASGKSDLAIQIAKKIDAYILSIDSLSIYKEVLQKCQDERKNLIIVGGTSFYLKSLIDGLSQIPTITKEISLQAEIKLKDLESCYNFLFGVYEKYIFKRQIPNRKITSHL